MPKNCPVCGSAHTRDARMYPSDGLVRRLFYSPRRCRGCRHRFWQRNHSKLFLLVALLFVAAGLTWWNSSQDKRPDPVIDRVSIVELLKQRADRGDPEAQYELGMRHLEGNGMPTNLAEATRYFALAARAGYVDAEYQQGLLLLQGRGVVQDYKAAFEWIEKAARRGHTLGQIKLGEMYRFGNGVPQDRSRAYLWFNLAAAQGDSFAALSRDSMANQLDPEELTAMQAEAKKLNQALQQGQEIPRTLAPDRPLPLKLQRSLPKGEAPTVGN